MSMPTFSRSWQLLSKWSKMPASQLAALRDGGLELMVSSGPAVPGLPGRAWRAVLQPACLAVALQEDVPRNMTKLFNKAWRAQR